jgi:hypothetical protein
LLFAAAIERADQCLGQPRRHVDRAFEPEEVRQQLDAAKLAHLAVEAVGDIHLIAYGRLP